MPFLRIRLPFVALAFVALASVCAAQAGDITLYRCVGAKGAIAVQDQPCPADAQQTVLKMVRPVDAPPRPQRIAEAAPAPVVVHDVQDRYPQPTWECTNAQTGETYLNHSGVPQSRYVPYWTTGVTDGFFVRGELTPSQALHPAPPLRRPDQPPPPPPERSAHRSHGRSFGGLPGYAYVEDSCVPLQQDEVCARMRGRDDALQKLIFNAQPSDRRGYEREQKGVRQQLRADCG